MDKAGNVYTSDFGHFLGQVPNFTPANKIFKITPEGKVTVFADSLLGASGSAFDKEGRLYQSNIQGNFVSRINPDGTRTIFTNDSIVAPVGVLALPNGEAVVCNCGNNTLRKVDSTGVSTLFSSGEVFKCPNGITADDDGNFYVANFFDGNVVKITASGEASVFATIPGNNNGHLVYRDGFLYLVARSAHQIYKVSMDGKAELLAGTGDRGRKNSTLLESTFSFPNDLDFSPDGKYLYVNEEADTLGNHRILTPTIIRRLKIE